ncbi:MAG: class A beta-lactamase [Phenylobacterium sp.]
MLIGAGAFVVAGCAKSSTLTASRTPALDVKRLDADVRAIAKRAAPGVLGFSLMNLESGQSWTWNGERRFPMQSVFKMTVGAATLAEVDAGRMALNETISIGAKDLSPPRSPIANAWPGRTVYTTDELLVAAVSDSDNTAADVLMKHIGGPGAVSGWLQAQKIEEVRVDRYERELQPESFGLASFRPAWKGAAFDAAIATVPVERQRAATDAYLRDPRDTATPRGMMVFLAKLDAGELLSPASTRRLISIMAHSPRGPERLKAGLPVGVQFAHKIGTGSSFEGRNSAYNDVGIFTLADKRSYAITAFLTASTADERGRAALLADLGRAAARAVG